MLLPSININPGAPDTEKKGPSSGEKAVDSATAFSVFLPFILSSMSTPNPENTLGDLNSAESGGTAFTPETTVQQQGGIGEKQSPVLADIAKAALGIEATDGRTNPQDKTGVTNTPNPANIIGKPGNKAQETSAETTTEAGKATTSLTPQKELPTTNGPYGTYKLKPVHPDKPADINNTAGQPKTTQKTEGAGKNNATPDKGALVKPIPDGKTPKNASGFETPLHHNRKDTGIPSRSESRPDNENSFVFQKTDIPEADSQQANLNSNSSTHKTGDTILPGKLPEMPGAQINKATPSHKNHPSIELTIEPEGLGKIDIEVSVHDGEVRAELGVEKIKSLMNLQNNMPQLFDSLAKVGITPGGFSLFLKNRGHRKWMKAQYNQKDIKDIALNPQKSNNGNQGLYTVSIRV
ncbi:hypothetical protein MNBD_NITROSPIRAE03-1824 [hydrothermal vent metagenome]|uniref:Flagellar hook-length control protein-like C-terminal domain-containing protein n=1 Tax=hydrothermal vent metagenome TaxID=652676 RepID=A0A3B1DQ33_9ZZZZ